MQALMLAVFAVSLMSNQRTYDNQVLRAVTLITNQLWAVLLLARQQSRLL